MDSSIHRQLKDALPSGGLLTDPRELKRYRSDSSLQSAPPSAVLFPKTTLQVQDIVQLAHEERLPLTLRGGGTGLGSGAATPEGGLVLCLSRMDRVLEVSPENSLAVVQPGISAFRLERHLESSGWFYPVDPAGWRQSTIGGDVATRAHGLRTARYGPIGNHLLGLEVVISPGEIIRCGARTLKCATGYHLVDLFAGSLGRLGVITQIILRLTPRPPVRKTLTAVIRDLRAAAGMAADLRKAGLQPARLELIGPQTSRQGFAELLDELPEDGYLLLMELEGADQEDLDGQVERAASCLRDPAASQIQPAGREQEAREWWRRREELLRRLTDQDRPFLLVTVRLPASRLPAFRKQTAGILKDGSCEGLFYGHLEEGRWHLLVRQLDEHTPPNEVLPAVSLSLEEVLTAQNGFFLPPVPLGWIPQKPLAAQHDSGQRRLWKALKNRFDPLELFGPIE